MKTHIFRLKPGADLKTSLEDFVREQQLTAAFIVTCVGGLQQATVRMAGATPDAQDIRTFSGDFEIVSLVGTISIHGVHLHMSFSDTDGVVRGGHLKEGTVIHPTAEVVLGAEETQILHREPDPETGFDELVVRSV